MFRSAKRVLPPGFTGWKF